VSSTDSEDDLAQTSGLDVEALREVTPGAPPRGCLLGSEL